MRKFNIFINSYYNLYTILDFFKKRDQYSKFELQKMFYDNMYEYIMNQISNIDILLRIGIKLGVIEPSDYPEFYPNDVSPQYLNNDFFEYVKNSFGYTVTLDETDYLKIYSLDNNFKYNRYQTIETNCVKKIHKMESSLSGFNSWNEFYDISYDVIVNENYFVPEKAYTLWEIQRFVDSGIIVVVDKYERKMSPDEEKISSAYTELYDTFYFDFEKDFISLLSNEDHKYHNSFVAYYLDAFDKDFIKEMIDSCIKNIKYIFRKPSKNAYREFCKMGVAHKFIEVKTKKDTISLLLDFENDNQLYDHFQSQIKGYWDIMTYVNYSRRLKLNK